MVARSTPSGASFDFDSSQPGMAGLVNGRLTITAPAQKGNDVTINAQLLPPAPDSPPPAGKGINRLIRMVIHPRVTDKQTGLVLTTFDPPLTLTVTYTADDLAGVSNGPDGNPQLFLVTFYSDGSAWRWQKLATTVDSTQMTLTATLTTLTPADPVGVGN